MTTSRIVAIEMLVASYVHFLAKRAKKSADVTSVNIRDKCAATIR